MTADALRLVVIYARFSTDRQDARSLDDQIRRCRAYAAQHGCEVLGIYQDAAESGAHVERADLQRLLGDATRSRPAPFAAVLVDDTSRLSRDLGSAWQLIFGDLASANVSVIDASTGRASSDKDAWMSFGMTALINHCFLQMVRHETHRGMEGRALAGFWTGGKTYGYTTVTEEKPPDPEHPRKVPVIEPDEADLVRRVFHLFASGMSLKKIASTLNEEHIAAPHDGGRGNKIGRGWPHSTIRAALLNPRYVGRWIWNQSKWVHAPGKKSRRRVARPEVEWVVKDVPSLRIVPQELWEEVQARFRRRATATKGRPAATGKYISLLSGLLRCGKCNGSMTVVGRKVKDGVAYARFGCTTHAQRGASVCDNAQTVSERRAVAAIIGALRLALAEPGLVRRFTDGFTQKLNELYGGVDAGREALDKKIRAAEQQARRLVEGIANHGYSDTIGQLLREAEGQLGGLKQQRSSLDQNLPGKILPHPTVIESYLNDLLGVLEVDPTRGRELLAKHLGPVVMTPEQSGTERFYRATGAFNLSVAIRAASSAGKKETAPDPFESEAVLSSSGGRI